MLVDTGADACFIDHRLAYSIGLNPVEGGRVGSVQGIGDALPTAEFPIDLILTSFDFTLRIRALFSPMESSGWNGLLGHRDFLERFECASFYPGVRFDLALAG